MTGNELARLDPKEIRINSEKMRLYIQLYEDAFSVRPNCAGCTFNKDWIKFRKHYGNNAKTLITETIKSNNMEFKIKPKYKGTIFTYKVGNRPMRSYGRTMTVLFAIAFLADGTEEEQEAKKDYFEVLPRELDSEALEVVENTTDGDTVINEADLFVMTRKELEVVASGLGIEEINTYKNKAALIAKIEEVKK